MGLDSRKAFIPTRAPLKLLSTKTARRLQLNLPLPDLDQMSQLHFDLVLRVHGPGNFASDELLKPEAKAVDKKEGGTCRQHR